MGKIADRDPDGLYPDLHPTTEKKPDPVPSLEQKNSDPDPTLESNQDPTKTPGFET